MTALVFAMPSNGDKFQIALSSGETLTIVSIVAATVVVAATAFASALTI